MNSAKLHARILIVDDDEPELKALCEMLDNAGYETVGLTGGKAGLAAFRESKFDLLLAGLTLPDMDGVRLMCSALEMDRELVGIIITGKDTIKTAVEATKSGPLDFILKPVKLNLVLPVLSRALVVRRLRLENAELQRELQKRSLELQKAGDELESFTHSVSHDLRAPLRAIGGFSNILLKDFAPRMPDEARRLVNIVVSSAAQLTQMIDGLLTLSRVSRQPIAYQIVNVSELADQAIMKLRRDEKGRRIDVRLGDLPQCAGDPALLSQALTILLSNAFKFTRRTEHPSVEIGFRSGESQNIYFVRDNGAGFDMQYAERLFGIFQRLHSEGEFNGNGVGLTIAQRIIQRHAGRIWAEAEVNKGATFFFTLPDSRSQAAAAKPND